MARATLEDPNEPHLVAVIEIEISNTAPAKILAAWGDRRITASLAVPCPEHEEWDWAVTKEDCATIGDAIVDQIIKDKIPLLPEMKSFMYTTDPRVLAVTVNPRNYDQFSIDLAIECTYALVSLVAPNAERGLLPLVSITGTLHRVPSLPLVKL